jgi:hypothetical protein
MLRTDLSINTNETAVILFNKKRALKGLKNLFGYTVRLSTEVKYLGITLGKG